MEDKLASFLRWDGSSHKVVCNEALQYPSRTCQVLQEITALGSNGSNPSWRLGGNEQSLRLEKTLYGEQFCSDFLGYRNGLLFIARNNSSKKFILQLIWEAKSATLYRAQSWTMPNFPPERNQSPFVPDVLMCLPQSLRSSKKKTLSITNRPPIDRWSVTGTILPWSSPIFRNLVSGWILWHWAKSSTWHCPSSSSSSNRFPSVSSCKADQGHGLQPKLKSIPFYTTQG